jgi:hypothetical protein
LDWTWELPAAFAPAIVAAGLLCGPATSAAWASAKDRPAPVGSNGSRRRRGRGEQFGLGVATILCAWIAIWVAGDQLIASVKLDSSRQAVDQGSLDAAQQSARDAAAIQPWSPEPQLQLALVDKQQGDLAAAQQAAQKAVDLAPGDWRGWLVGAEVAAAAGMPGVAKFELARANQLSPRPLRVVLSAEP